MDLEAQSLLRDEEDRVRNRLDLKRGLVFLVVLLNSLKAFFNKQRDFIAPGVGRTGSMSGRCGGPSFKLWLRRPQ